MAFYLVHRTDTPAFGEHDAAVIRAKGRRQAAQLAAATLEGFESNPKGSNFLVSKLEDDRETPNDVVVSSYALDL